MTTEIQGPSRHTKIELGRDLVMVDGSFHIMVILSVAMRALIEFMSKFNSVKEVIGDGLTFYPSGYYIGKNCDSLLNTI
jgi:hypothetical protein